MKNANEIIMKISAIFIVILLPLIFFLPSNVKTREVPDEMETRGGHKIVVIDPSTLDKDTIITAAQRLAYLEHIKKNVHKLQQLIKSTDSAHPQR